MISFPPVLCLDEKEKKANYSPPPRSIFAVLCTGLNYVRVDGSSFFDFEKQPKKNINSRPFHYYYYFRENNNNHSLGPMMKHTIKRTRSKGI
jgi:hypothetical protein